MEEWISKNCGGKSPETKWANGIEYKFYSMKDGWIAVFEVSPDGLSPVIQSKDVDHAEAYISMIEPAPFQMQKL